MLRSICFGSNPLFELNASHVDSTLPRARRTVSRTLEISVAGIRSNLFGDDDEQRHALSQTYVPFDRAEISFVQPVNVARERQVSVVLCHHSLRLYQQHRLKAEQFKTFGVFQPIEVCPFFAQKTDTQRSASPLFNSSSLFCTWRAARRHRIRILQRFFEVTEYPNIVHDQLRLLLSPNTRFARAIACMSV